VKFVPTVTDAIAPEQLQSFNFLSDNTTTAIYVASTAEPNVYNGLPSTERLSTSFVPDVPAAMTAYGYSKWNHVIIDQVGPLDFLQDNGYGTAQTLPMINALLDAGKEVLIADYPAMFYVYVDAYPDVANTGTDDIHNFFENRLGLTWTMNIQRWSGSTFTPWPIGGLDDPISKGISTTNAGGTVSETYTINEGSHSTALFFADDDSSSIVGSRYEDPNTHGKLVFLGFQLSALSGTAGNKIVTNSQNWLTAPPAGVEQPVIVERNFTAAANPFHAATQISYVSAEGEHDVTFSAFDLLGREVAKLTPKVSGSTVTATFDANTLPAGTYVIVKHSSTGTQELRIVNE
jgi:hypothetical protein